MVSVPSPSANVAILAISRPPAADRTNVGYTGHSYSFSLVFNVGIGTTSLVDVCAFEAHSVDGTRGFLLCKDSDYYRLRPRRCRERLVCKRTLDVVKKRCPEEDRR